jgi:hypothetical protein
MSPRIPSTRTRFEKCLESPPFLGSRRRWKSSKPRPKISRTVGCGSKSTVKFSRTRWESRILRGDRGFQPSQPFRSSYPRRDSLLRLSGTNKYFNEFLTRQYPQEFFLVGQAFVPPPARNQEDNKKRGIESLHPIFHHLYFTHKMNPELVRVRDAFGQFLACLKVRNQFATRPAMTQLCISRESARRCRTINHRYTRTVSPPSPISLTPSPPHARPRRRLPWSGPQVCHRTHPSQVQLLCTSTTHDPNNTRRKCHDGRELPPPLNRSPEHVCGYSYPPMPMFCIEAHSGYRAFGVSPPGNWRSNAAWVTGHSARLWVPPSASEVRHQDH